LPSATYDELLFTPISRVIFPLYCLFWIGVAMIADMIANVAQGLTQPARTVAMIVLGVVASLALAGAARMLGGADAPAAQVSSSWLLAQSLAVFCAVSGLVAAVWPRREESGVVPKRTFPVAVGVAVVLPLAVINYRPATSLAGVLQQGSTSSTPAGVMAIAYRRYVSTFHHGPPTQCIDKVIELLGHKVPDSLCVPPLSVVESVLRAGLSPNSVLLVDPLGAFSPIGFLPVRLAGPMLNGDMVGPYRDWTVAFPNFRDVIVRALEAHSGMPFFAPDENAGERYSDARALGVTHVLASPPERERVMAAARARPDLFKLLLDESGWVLVVMVKPTVPEAAGW
jgi:hypothetical protein